MDRRPPLPGSAAKYEQYRDVGAGPLGALQLVRLALSPDGGGTRELPRLVGYARACELTMLPTELDAKTALDWGLVNWVVPDERLDEETAARAATLARMPAGALARAKVLLNLGELDELASQMEAERLAQIANSESPDFDEGLRAFVEKREPVFNRG